MQRMFENAKLTGNLEQSKVLLFGQSAGAENVYIVGSLPQAPSLINGLVSESGGGRSLVSNATQQQVGASYAQTLGCSTSDVSLGFPSEMEIIH